MKLLAILLLCVGFVSAAEVEYGNLVGYDTITLEKGDVFTMLANNLSDGSASIKVRIEKRIFYTIGKTICGPCEISIDKGGRFCSYQIIRSASASVQVVTYPLSNSE